MDKKQITIKELREAIKDMPDDALCIIEGKYRGAHLCELEWHIPAKKDCEMDAVIATISETR